MTGSLRHFVQYHHSGRFGPPGEPVEGGYSVMTRKRAFHLPGSLVWKFLGEGQPRQFYLYEVFLAKEVFPVDQGEFLYRIWGEKGVRFQPFLDVTDYPWFLQMKRRLGNFSLGLTEVTGQYSQFLLDLARQFSDAFCAAEAKGWFQDT